METDKTVDRAVFGGILKTLREEKSLSQAELAEKLGKTQQAIDTWERGVALPQPDAISWLASFHDVSTDYLLGRTIVRRPIETIAANRADDFRNELPPEKQEEIERFIKFAINEHRQKQNLPPI
jgi:transcriptional regulator with XRE-family HTH domain